MDIQELSDIISKFGFPLVSSFGMIQIVKYVWDYTTKQINPILTEAQRELIGLIDRVRLLDNDLLRLQSKLNTVLQMREIPAEKPKTTKKSPPKTG